jgi:predicted F0F1-ATPase subunit
MNSEPRNHHREDVRDAVRRDFARRARRDPRNRSFWQSLGVLGMVGWPIALACVGGALLGRRLDERFGTGIRFTLMLLTLGVIIGSYTAWRAVGGRQ